MRANQITGTTSDFKLGVINGDIASAIHSPPCDTTKSTHFAITLTANTLTYSLPERDSLEGFHGINR